jgi:hypothetical protein
MLLYRFLHRWNKRYFVYEATKVPPLSYYDVEGESSNKKEKLALGKKDKLEASMGLKPLLVAFPKEQQQHVSAKQQPQITGGVGADSEAKQPRGAAYVIDVSDRNDFPNFPHSTHGFRIRVMEVDYR